MAALVKGTKYQFLDSDKVGRYIIYYWLTRAALLYVRQVIRTLSASTVLITLPQLGAMEVKPIWLYARFTGTVQVARDGQ